MIIGSIDIRLFLGMEGVLQIQIIGLCGEVRT